MELELDGRVALVTGAGRGIGLAVASALAAEGAKLALLARDAPALERAVARVSAGSGRPALAVAADVTDGGVVEAAVARVEEELGSVEILVTAAATPNTPAGFDEDELADHLDVKLGGALRCARAVAPGMTSRGWGRIVCISGLAARTTGSVVGTVRNVAVAAMVKNLADELGPGGINVTCVHPGMTVTERTPALLDDLARARGVDVAEVERGLAQQTAIGRMPTAREVADVVTFLCSPRSVAVNGDAVAVGGGARGSIHY